MNTYIKKFNKNTILTLTVLVFSIAFGLASPIAAFAATSPSLGATSTYAVTSSTYTNSLNAALETAITGDLCYTTGPGTTPVSISGATVVPCDPARGTDQSTALADLNSQACTNLGVNVVLSGTYTPGCYFSTGTMDITLNTTVTLNGTGTYIFRSGGAFTTGANSVVALSGGASACDVFWAPGGATQIGANSSTSATPTFVGNILQDSLASFDITIGHFVNLSGRILAFGRTVTTDSNTISVPTGCTVPPATLTVIKHIINNNGGTATAGNWNLALTSSNGGTGTGSAAGAESPGTTYTLQTGSAYSVAESGGPSGYLEMDSTDCSIASAVAGTNYTCTVTNDDIAPQLIVTKIVVGGTKAISDFPLFVSGTPVVSGVTNTFPIGAYTVSETTDSNYTQSFSGNCVSGNISLALGDLKTCTITNTFIPLVMSISGSAPIIVPPLIDVVKVPSPLALPNGPGPVTYTYTVHNIGTVPMTNITMVGDSCSPIIYVSGDTNGDSRLDTNETWTYDCFTTLSQTHTNNVTATGWANGISAIDIASATVVVGVPGLPNTGIMPPLIHVTKVPSPLALFAGGGMVTYTNKVTNPGVVPLSDVSLTDDKCGPVTYVSGDTNGNSMLDTNETWVYTCATRLNQTTTNTITATGIANGITARDFAIATVIVAVPGLPRTGFPPQQKNSSLNIVILSGLFVSSILFYIFQRKQNV